jgi:hypothetical protein
MQWAMGANVNPQASIKSHHSYGGKLRSFTTGVSKKGLQFSTKSAKFLKVVIGC